MSERASAWGREGRLAFEVGGDSLSGPDWIFTLFCNSLSLSLSLARAHTHTHTHTHTGTGVDSVWPGIVCGVPLMSSVLLLRFLPPSIPLCAGTTRYEKRVLILIIIKKYNCQ